MEESKRSKIVRYIGMVLIPVVFLMTTTYIILLASGYKIEFSKGDIIQTGVIVVETKPKTATLYVNGTSYATGGSWDLTGLISGTYSLKVSADDYFTWGKQIALTEGQVALYENVVLFLREPVTTTVDGNSEKADLVSDLNTQTPDSRVAIEDNEIWFDGAMVTRLSSEPYNVQVYPDDAHLSFIANNKFHVIEIDGGNDVTLFDLQNDADYLFLNNGGNVLCLEGDSLKTVEIR